MDSKSDSKQNRTDDIEAVEHGLVLTPSAALKENIDHGADTELHRTLGSRHLTMIALGSSIGMGFWLGSGSSLAKGGPASLVLGFCFAATVVWSVCHAMGEMAVLYPLPSAFVQWSTKFCSPAAGFALGWAYWLQYCITMANELQICSTVLSFWTDRLPTAAIIVLFFFLILSVNIFGVSIFGEVEVCTSTIKFGYIVIIAISMIIISAGGAPNHEKTGFRYWAEEPFIGGFAGFLAVLTNCIFSMSGSENSGLVACEVKDPRRSVPKSVGSIWLRLSIFYVVGSIVVTIATDPKNPDLFGAGGTNSSPFVLAYRAAGLDPLAHVTNAVILISVLSNGSISIYTSSRTLVGLAHLGMAPKQMKKADHMGRPWYAMVPSIALGFGLAFLNVNHSGSEVFTWLSSLVALFTLFGWGMICLTNLRMRYAWKSQRRSAHDLPWKSWTSPYSAWWGLISSVLLMVVQFYLAVWPYDEKSSAEIFFATFLSVPAILVLYIGAQVYYRGPIVANLSTVDLDEGRRFYSQIDPAEANPRSVLMNTFRFIFG
ncbi:hypothetical protein G7054_g7729 [Neopestalotiopsis clavispora]|nr:hypothetical protein G7054_g7729 [Neopestalotiopsis clavispora]